MTEHLNVDETVLGEARHELDQLSRRLSSLSHPGVRGLSSATVEARVGEAHRLHAARVQVFAATVLSLAGGLDLVSSHLDEVEGSLARSLAAGG